MSHASGNPTWQDYPSTATPITAASLENVETRLDTLSTAAPVCSAQLTTAYTNLAAGDYIMSGNMTVVADPQSMFSAPSGYPYRVTIGQAGRYEILWKWATSTAGAAPIAHVLKNCPNGTTGNSAVTGYSLLSNPGANANGGGEAQVLGSEIFNVGDWLWFAIYAGVTFTMPVTVFGGIRTKFVVRYTGPN